MKFKFFSFRRDKEPGPKSMFIVRKDPKDNPRDDDCGFRYYLPKPYLLVSHKREAETNPNTGSTVERVTPEVKIIYLPDVQERYSVTIKSGVLRSFKGNLPLTDGWMLTQINQKYDTKMTETMQAFASLASAIKPTPTPPFPPGAHVAGPPVVSPPSPAPRATSRTIAAPPLFELYEIDLEGKALIPLSPQP